MYPNSTNSMQCIVCVSESKKAFLIRKFDSEKSKQKECMDKALIPNKAVAAAPYKLAFMITKHKMPFNKCEAIVDFARSADPESPVFARMSNSR